MEVQADRVPSTLDPASVAWQGMLPALPEEPVAFEAGQARNHALLQHALKGGPERPERLLTPMAHSGPQQVAAHISAHFLTSSAYSAAADVEITLFEHVVPKVRDVVVGDLGLLPHKGLGDVVAPDGLSHVVGWLVVEWGGCRLAEPGQAVDHPLEVLQGGVDLPASMALGR